MRAVPLVLALALSFPQAQFGDNGVIEGFVVRYGTTEGLANVEITLALQGASTRYATAEAATDDSGHFLLSNVVPGKYTIQVSRGGYVNPAPNGVRLRDGGTTRDVVLGPGQHIRDAN